MEVMLKEALAAVSLLIDFLLMRLVFIVVTV